MIVPDDMNDRELAKKFNAEAVTSVRDTLILLGYTDEELRRYDIDRAEMEFGDLEIPRADEATYTLPFTALATSAGGNEFTLTHL